MEKKLIVVGNIKGIDKAKRQITAYASTDDWDRYGEKFAPDAFKEGMESYLKNPVVLWAHDYSQEPVAKSVDYQFDSKGLILTMQFADTEKARDVFDLYVGGFLSAFSVGFIPKEIAKEERAPGVMGVCYKKAELLENSCVPVPANPGALVIKSLMPQAVRVFGGDDPAKQAEPAKPAAVPPAISESGDFASALEYVLTLAKALKFKGKIEDENKRSLLVQMNNLCRELIYGEKSPKIDGGEGPMSDEEADALVAEFEAMVTAAAGKNLSVEDKKEIEKIGELIGSLISQG